MLDDDKANIYHHHILPFPKSLLPTNVSHDLQCKCVKKENMLDGIIYSPWSNPPIYDNERVNENVKIVFSITAMTHLSSNVKYPCDLIGEIISTGLLYHFSSQVSHI